METHNHIHNSAHMHITSVTDIDKLLYSFLVVVSAIIKNTLVLKDLKCLPLALESEPLQVDVHGPLEDLVVEVEADDRIESG